MIDDKLLILIFIIFKMSLNENGLYAASWKPTDNFEKISEGAVVGIAFGWIIGVILFYILGLIIIMKCISVRRYESESGENKSK
jgi:hypothetical protein